MACQEAFLKELHARGFRLTPQRGAVLAVMHRLDGHATAEEIYARAQEAGPAIDVSTVYRTLELLHEMGLAGVVELGDGQRRYELLSVEGPHHHMKCRCCGEMVRVEPEELQPLLEALGRAHGFQIDLDHLVIEGLCARCREAQGAKG
ncbi:MAG: transcriptional repressor [Chloroflexi bacterium]|nr:transcriptional repressor [Chloroflexota bacterium]